MGQEEQGITKRMIKRTILVIMLIMTTSLQVTWAQKVVIHPTGKDPIEFEVTELDSITFIDASKMQICPDDHHPHAIDLGLPSGTKWSCCNVGASRPEDSGGYYAWGETSEKDYYSWNTYAYYGVSIGSDIANSSYDVANVCMGSPWRMPSVEQMVELHDNCFSQWTNQNDVNGLLLTGASGNQIFLPAVGRHWIDGLLNVGSRGCYWSCSLQNGCDFAYTLYFSSGGYAIGYPYTAE